MTKKILLIDDDQVTNFFNRKLIEQSNAPLEVKTVSSVTDAITFLRENKNYWFPDVIFVDIFMPIKSGWDFLEEFQQEFESHATTIKLYMLSSSNHHDDINKAKDHYLVKDYISKPLSSNMLGDILS
ncbi:response regulator [Flavobacterium jejuense]|uniref:Response regulator n=1 Tax=Flavobacterium jejuense TaxID=1544455 RepID=A0ABX0J1L2_9FLAO|nr:response regulator [Flavobacterium jejuense]NHN27810.1 response regulator [Flavobacterium jejuense]